MKRKVARKLYKIAYSLGVASLMVSLVMGAVPPTAAQAHATSGAIWTLNSQCGPSQNINQYPVGASPFINFAGGLPNDSDYSWDIEGVSGGSIPHGVFVSGPATTDADGAFTPCIDPGYVILPGHTGTFRVNVYNHGHKVSSDNYRIAGDAPTNTPDAPTATPITPSSTPITPSSTPITPSSTPITPSSTPITPSATPVTPSATPSDTPTGTLPPSDTPTSTPTSTSTPTATPTGRPNFSFTDPCAVGCNQPDAVSNLCNTSDVDYVGDIEWKAFLDGNKIDGGTLQDLAANSCVDISVPRQGEGTYSFEVFIVSLEIMLEASCNLQCAINTSTPVPPPPPAPSGGAVLIPVTGFDFNDDGGVLVQRVFQNLGFGFLSLGLALHGFSLRMKDEEETE